MDVNGFDCSDMVASYIGTALWSSSCWLPCMADELVDGCMNVDEEHPLHGISEGDRLDAHFDTSDCTDEMLSKAIKDCEAFKGKCEGAGLWDRMLELHDEGQIGHDLWLTRNGHGAGFWESEWEEIGDQVTSLVRNHFSELDIWIDEDGKLSF